MKILSFIAVLVWHLSSCCLRSFGVSTLSEDESFYQHCRLGNVTAVQGYLVHDFPVNSRDSKGNTGMIIASGRGQVAVIQLLLQHGANPEDSTMIGIFEGKTALMWASSQGRLEVVALLVRVGVDPHRVSDKGVFAGKNALMWAASQGKTKVVSYLLSIGVDVEYTSSAGNFQGKNALMWASSQGREDTVRVLLEAGCHVNAVDTDGVSALMWAAGSEAAGEDGRVRQGLQLERALKGHVKVVQLLLKYAAEPDMKDKDGITAVMFACYHGHVGAVKVLINAGSCADYMSREGKTAIQLARNSGHNDSVQAILDGPTFLLAELDDLRDMTACGWVISVLRAPEGTGIITRPEYRNSTYLPPYSTHESNIACAGLRQHGLSHSMYDLLVVVHGSESIDEVVRLLDIRIYGSRIRAKMQLTTLYEKHKSRIRNDTQYFESAHTCMSCTDHHIHSEHCRM